MLGSKNCFLYENMMYLFFETLILILFAFNHLFIDNKSLFITFTIRSVGVFLKEQVKVLSSAKRLNWNWLELLEKSFMRIKTNKGTGINPCRTPQSINRRSEIWSLMDTYCFLLDKYDRNQLEAIPETPYEIN